MHQLAFAGNTTLTRIKIVCSLSTMAVIWLMIFAIVARKWPVSTHSSTNPASSASMNCINNRANVKMWSVAKLNTTRMWPSARPIRNSSPDAGPMMAVVPLKIGFLKRFLYRFYINFARCECLPCQTECQFGTRKLITALGAGTPGACCQQFEELSDFFRLSKSQPLNIIYVTIKSPKRVRQ